MDYYAELELSPDATADDIKRQYRKLALQYHPDRHPGKEDEVVPRFQAIGQAHEVLLDPEQRRKYDLSRQRPNQQPFFPRQANTSRRQNPPFPTTTNFEPPPRRNDPRYPSQSQQRPDGDRFNAPPPQPNGAAAGSAGASRYTSWSNQAPPPPPRAANTSSKADAKQRANVFNTWQNMRYANKTQTPYPHPPRQEPPQPPPRRPAEGPHRPEGPQRGRAESIPPASGPFGREGPSNSSDRANNAARGKPGFRVPPPYSGFNQGPMSPQDARTPGTTGPPPATPGGMQQPPRSANANYPPPPFFKQGPPPPQNNPGLDPNSARRGYPQQDASAGTPNDSTDYRHSTPYTQNKHEKLFVDSDALRRSASTRDATRFAQQEAQKRSQEPYHKRAQSAGRSPDSTSPRSRPPSSYDADDSDVESATSGIAGMGMNGNANGTKSPPFFKQQAQHHQRSPLFQNTQQNQQHSPHHFSHHYSKSQPQQTQPSPQQTQQQQSQKDGSPTPEAMDIDPPPSSFDNMQDMSSNLPQSSNKAKPNGVRSKSFEGFHRMGDMAADLPKAAQATTTASSDSSSGRNQDVNNIQHTHNMPHRQASVSEPPSPPKTPHTPQHLTRESWATYLGALSKYMNEYAAFNSRMVACFQESASRIEKRLEGPAGGMVDGWLGAVGSTGHLGEWEQYCESLRGDEKMRLHWNIARERHAEACERHSRLRQRVVAGELGGGGAATK